MANFDYASAYREDYGFEAVMVAARQELILELIKRERPKAVLEVGCGIDLLYEAAARQELRFDSWIIVEPSSEFASIARSRSAADRRVVVVEARLEDSAEAILSASRTKRDLIICSSLLHEVDDPVTLLEVIESLLDQEAGLLHINVPNPYSLHRRLARVMGLISDERSLTSRNIALNQRRVMAVEELEAIVLDTGLTTIERGGYMIKPFTHAQMASLSFLTPQLVNGLVQLGYELPDLASEIFVNAMTNHAAAKRSRDG